MDGTGYPKGLTRDEMSLPTRMMAIADIFEALTAGDRPYKKAKMLSECLRIMGFMRDDDHIDPDLFDLFLPAGIWSEYADQFLDPAQIDDIDIGDYLGDR
jgi:HD-GYP domain-containing protein (c-di-GMP phosphodiesterase class II)